MNKTPLVEFVYNRHKTASATKEAAVELRVTFERKQKYMTTGVRLLPKQWHRGTVTNRVDAIQLNQTLEKLMIDVLLILAVGVEMVLVAIIGERYIKGYYGICKYELGE